MPNKGKKPAGGAKGHGGKKTDGTPKPTDKKSSETAEKKYGTTSTSTSTSTSSSAAAAGSSRVPTSQDRTMKPADTKPKSTTKTEPPKPTQTSVPKSTTTSKSTTATSSTVKPSTEKASTKQDIKAAPQKQKSDSTKPSGAASKAAAASVVATSKPKDVVKEEKKSVSTGSAAAAASTTGDKDALDLLSDSLGGPDTVPESPKFTGPEIADTPATSEHVEKLGDRDSTIPPEYRHLLDGKGEKPAPPPPEEARKSLGDDDLVAAFSSDFVSSQAPPEEKKPKLEEPKSSTPKSSTVPSTTEKVTTKQDLKAAPQKQKSDTTVHSGAVGKAAAVPVVSTSKPRDETIKEKKTVTVQQIAAVPATSEKDEALDLLIDSLGGPDTVPESPKFTGPEIADTPVTSEHLERLGDRDSTIPPEYRHLLDGKGEKPAPPPAEEARKSLGDDDLVAAFSSDFVSCQAPPDEKKPKLEEIQKKEAKPISSGPTAPTQSSTMALSDEALDELLGTLEGPPTTEPDSPQYTGPEITETITKSYLEELGKRDSTIPPEYRHLLDGKDQEGKPLPPPAVQPPPLSDASLVDEFSKDFESCISPAATTTPALQPKDAAQDKQAKSDVVVPSAASSVQAASAPSAGMESALDELMGTLEGPEFSVPESPVYTGPEVTETSTATYIEELGKRDSSIPPAYRHLLDGKEDGKPVLPKPEDKPMSDKELVDAFDLEFACPQSPAAQQTPPAQPKDAAKVKKTEVEAVVSSSSSARQAAPAPSKSPAGKVDPLDALAGTLSSRKEDPKEKKPAADKIKEKTSKENKEKLGEDEETIPPDYRLHEVKDKDGKPLLPKPDEKPKAMSEDELLDALTEGFDTTPVPAQCAPLQSSAKVPGKSQSAETVSCSKASAVHSAGKPSASISDDALDLLSGSLGERQPDPDEYKPVVDVIKEKMKEEFIHKPGETDGSIPPEYRHLLDGKEEGKPAKPESVKPQDKIEKSPSVHKTETPGKVPDSSKSTSQKSLEKPSAQKTSKS
ncbi:calpastatin isoform X2 [Engystomops pustulosus]|uniref:calpastatin isoform X2 n=1 Tax=Engystomops pustulosus TaxID=76066 RepID=UPI003AFAA06B